MFSPPPLWGRGRGRGVQPGASPSEPGEGLPEGEHAGEDALRVAVAALRAGQIVAVKGLGGFQLACNAADESAVSRLRERKAREARPFAIMVRDLEAARALCEISAAEAAVLSGPRAPIVLLRRRHPLLAEAVLAEGVAPGLDTLGIMLPGTPLHHLLLREFGGPLVMTSGNRSEEPIVIGNEEAEARLSGITDALLLHDREIASRYDDSVVRVDDGEPVVLRRARGFAPEPIRLPRAAAAPILATGAQLKNTFCLVRGDSAFVGQHIGDLDDALTLANYQQTLVLYRRLFAIEPMVVAHDLHPNYAATRFAHSLEGVTLVAVQHHHAHVVSCMAEHGVTEPVIGVAFDGTGYGTDGAVWGGELLVADWRGFRRVAHLAYLPLPGGDAAAREPWRMALAALIHAFAEEAEGLAADLLARIPAARRRPVLAMARRGFNAPPTSSVGRLFDAVAALAGVRDVNQYEGQAAMELEARLDQAERSAYALPLHAEGGVWNLNPLIRAVVDDVRRSTPCATIAARFHNALGAAVVEGCMRVREAEGLDIVALSGGCFQNRRLLACTRGALERAGFRVLTHRRIPPNDGGISLGQAAVAIAACEQL
ncbi:MAG: carbamoyltransferase HypF [Longimicrobiaceae bacterium]